MSKELLAKVILDSWERPLPKGIDRDCQIDIDIPVKRAITVIGPRRSGKTYLLYSIIRTLYARGIPPEQSIYLNFEHPIFAGAESNDILRALDTLYELSPHSTNEKVWLFFDEIQNITHWEKAIRHILDTENAQVFLSGSSAKLLSREIATSLRGRTITHTLYPFTFLEFLRAQNIALKKYYSSREQRELIRASQAYLTYGGYPEIVLFPEGRRKIIQDIIETVIQQDVIERHRVRNIKAIRLMFETLVKAKEFSVHGWYRHLRSLSLRVSKNSLYQYLDYFSDAFIFFPLRRFSHSLKEKEQSLPKIYCIDNAIIDEMIGDDKGKKLENAVFLSLLNRGYSLGKNLFYYRDRQEVDFVIRDGGKIHGLIQVCVDISDYRTREREIAGLIEASTALQCRHLTIITLDEEWKSTVRGKKIVCKPFWKWCLDSF